MMKFEENEFKYKWQEDIADESETMTFEELIDELINTAGLGSQITHRDEWEIKFLKGAIIRRYNDALDKVLDRWRKSDKVSKDEKLLKAIFDVDYRNKLLEKE